MRLPGYSRAVTAPDSAGPQPDRVVRVFLLDDHEIVRRGVQVDAVTDQTSAHDPLVGYIPVGLSLEAAAELRARDPQGYVRRSTGSMAVHVQAMLDLQRAGAVAFDYGNNIRAQAQKAGIKNAFDIPGFVPEYIRPLFCEGRGPFRWVALSGIITFALGCMIIAQWPASSLFVLGIFLGIDLIFIGSGWITMGLALRKRA